MQPALSKEPGAMTDQELDDFLVAARAENPDNSEETNPETQPETAVEPESANSDQPVEQPAGEPVPQPDPVKAAIEEAKSQIQADFEAKFNALRAENEKIRKDNVNLQKLNGHLSNQVGVLKKETPPLPTDTEMLENPVESTQRVVKLTLDEQKAKQDEQIALQNQSMLNTLSIVADNVPDFQENIDGMAEILKEAGASPEFIGVFKHNPVSAINDAPHLVHLAVRAKQARQIAELQKQLEEAKKGPQKLADGLKNAAGATPAITSTNVRAPAKKTGEPQDLQKMSYDDLVKLEASLRANAPPVDDDN